MDGHTVQTKASIWILSIYGLVLTASSILIMTETMTFTLFNTPSTAWNPVFLGTTPLLLGLADLTAAYLLYRHNDYGRIIGLFAAFLGIIPVQPFFLTIATGLLLTRVTDSLFLYWTLPGLVFIASFVLLARLLTR